MSEVPGDDLLPSIEWIGGELPRVVDQAQQVSLDSGESIFDRGGILVRPRRRGGSAARGFRRAAEALSLVPVDITWLQVHLTRCARFMRYDKRAESWRRINAPPLVAQALIAQRAWRYPRLVGVVSAPTLRPDGSVLQEAGYDAATGLLFDPGDTLFVPVAEAPSRTEAERAIEHLLAVLKGFPFVSECDESVALAAVLTALVRAALPTAPMVGITATAPGSGKTLLADVVAIIATGVSAAVTTQPSSEEELAKTLLALLMEGDPVVLIDNIERTLASETLCATLTSETFSGRLLGSNVTIKTPTNVTLMVTGNGLVIGGDLRMRTLLCRLDPRCERPEERQFQGDLRAQVLERRPMLVLAALTILRAFVVSGERAADIVKPFGRFERWSDTVRAALVWLGRADPCGSAKHMERDDPERISHIAVLKAWREAFGGQASSVREAIDLALRGAGPMHDALVAVARDRSGQLDAMRLGKWLQRFAGRIAEGMYFERGPTARGAGSWHVVSCADE